MGSIGQATQAGLWGLFAALSLPLGATVGLLASPISQRTVAACMAFGAGALIFAIAIELYGEAVTDLRLGNQGRFELIGLALSTVVGALIYTAIDRFILHRPTVSLNSLSRFGLSGPRPSPRTEWLAADAEREVIDGETAPLLGPASARRDSVQSVDDVEGGDQPPGTRTAASERSFAIILWFASWLDTLPQAILIGLLTGERRVHVSFVLAAFLANFPQSLASASLLMEFKASPCKVLGSWSFIWLVSASVAFFVGWATPEEVQGDTPGAIFKQSVFVVVSGLTGGAMIAFTSSTLLPAAFERSGRDSALSGMLCTVGFVAALVVEVFTGPGPSTAAPPSPLP